ncbi:choice-of-anchor tandem repeat GloVer-containing protein [Luteibaculum oceani]|uniref:T9SS type A sorting domain-containing protein n=1 Tax=Luteibaculum oceani TaxID=1294296 RepID=A0A5C6UUX7_9FLAO|nr:choice-of-anchor tandem repeat GloVer-containing protein [Luteibaculum oceani]TXC76051.1 T9SS type A sorting domain-containing protein [Luteibaculum oceani]
MKIRELLSKKTSSFLLLLCLQSFYLSNHAFADIIESNKIKSTIDGCLIDKSKTLEEDKTICSNSATTIQINGSQNSYLYQLVNKATNQNEGDPVLGTGGAITLPTGAITSLTTFLVKVSCDPTSQAEALHDEITISVVEDTEAPIAKAKDITLAIDGNGTLTITPEQIDNGSTDNCEIASMSVSPNTFEENQLGENTVTLTVTDKSGNSSQAKAFVSVGTHAFYGMTYSGGNGNHGVLFKFDPIDGSLHPQHNFDNVQTGSRPSGTLIEVNGKLYGMTHFGGAFNKGVLFEFDPSDNTISKIFDFDGANFGANPFGSLTEQNGKLYGLTKWGGVNDMGVLFEYDPSNNSISKKVDFEYTTKGRNPYGSLTIANGKLYGMTYDGGVFGHGVLFEFNPADNSFIKKIDLEATNKGRNPYGSLTLANEKLYGMTYGGGTSNHGVLFEFNPTDNSFTKKIDFDGSNKGQAAHGSLTLANGKLYGMTYGGGASTSGVLFQFNPADNSFTKKIDFDNTNKGRNPYGSLTLANGKLYGMTSSGGISNYGVLFEFNPTDNSFTKKVDFNGSNGRSPFGDLTSVIIVPSCSIAEQTAEADKSICPNTTTTITVNGSETGVNYQLFNKANDQSVGNAVAGTGQAITLTTNELSETTTFYVKATNAEDESCKLNLADEIKITVEDKVAPTLNVSILKVYLNVNGVVEISGENFRSFAQDNCSDQSALNISVSKTTFNCDNIGGNPVSVTLTDEQNNSKSYNVTVTVLDNIKPKVKVKNTNIYLDENGKAILSTDQIDNGSSDNCSFTLSVTKSSFTCANLGENTVYLTARDQRRNQNTKGATVTVLDTIAPTVKTNSITLLITQNTGKAFLEPFHINHGSFDNCGIKNLRVSRSEFTCSDIEQGSSAEGIKVWLIAEDASKNIDSAITTVWLENENTFQFESITACRSYTWPNNNQTYYSSGWYEHVYTNRFGCDSIGWLNLTINETYEDTIKHTSCTAYTWDANDEMYFSSGLYKATLTTDQGCDYDVYLDLIIQPRTGEQTVFACDPFTWDNGTTYDKSGTYTWETTSNNGCDSIATLFLTMVKADTTWLNVSACESYNWKRNDATYTESGIYSLKLTNKHGCDSILMLDLEILEPTASSTQLSSCSAITWNNLEIEQSGIYKVLLTNANGCDSTATLAFTRLEESTKEIFETSCGSYLWEVANTTLDKSGVYTHILKGANKNGCDSILSLNLTINQATFGDTTLTACGEYVSKAGNTYTKSGTYKEFFTNAKGCDSTYTINLTVVTYKDQHWYAEACESFTSRMGNTYTESGTYIERIQTSEGCFYNRYLHITINKSVKDTITVTNCNQYSWEGEVYTQSGSYTKSFKTDKGCDSTVTLNLTIFEPTASEITVSACKKYDWVIAKRTLNESGTYTHTTSNAKGCDSTITLNLTILAEIKTQLNVSSCEPYTWSNTNETYANTGVYTDTLTSVNGCDSIVELNLTIKPLEYNFVEMENGFMVTGNDITVNWFNCQDLTNPLPKANDSTFIPQQDGEYLFVVTNGACSDTSDCYSYTTTSITQFNKLDTDISVYPNPGNGLYTVEITANQSTNLSFNVFNAAGKLVWSENPKRTSQGFVIDIQNFADGVYFLQIMDGELPLNHIQLIKH